MTTHELDADPLTSSSLVDLLPWATSLLRSKRTLLLWMIAGTLFGLLVALLWPASYTATTEILPPQQRPSSASAMMSEMSAGAAALASAGTEFQARSMAEMYVHMLQAQPVLDGLIERFGLKNAYHLRYQYEARKALLSHTSISASKEGFVSIAVQDHDNQRAAAIANGFVEQMRALNHQLALTESSQRRIFYEAQLGKTKEELARAEVAFKGMQQNNRVISLDAQAKTLIEGAAQVRAQIAAKEVELDRLRSFATGNNPQVQLVAEELRSMRAQLNRSEAGGGAGYGSLGMSSVPSVELDFVRSSRELRYQESVYELLLKQYEVARVDEARDAPVVQVLEVATPAERASWPRKSVLMPCFAFFGLLVGCLMVICRQWREGLDQRRSAKWMQLRDAWWAWK